jgi:hypothetical protein
MRGGISAVTTAADSVRVGIPRVDGVQGGEARERRPGPRPRRRGADPAVRVAAPHRSSHRSSHPRWVGPDEGKS